MESVLYVKEPFHLGADGSDPVRQLPIGALLFRRAKGDMREA